MDEVIRPAKARALQKRKAQSNTTPAAKRKRFLSVLAATCHVGRSAKAAGIATSTAYMMRRTNPAFAAQWQEALTLGYERLETALRAFALDGLDEHGRGFVLEDASIAGASPEGWARAVALCAERHGADRVIAEKNQGGDMVASVLRAADAGLAVKLVHASRGKAARAEPVVALYERGRVRHVGALPALEDELCGLLAGGGYVGPGRSPDRADACVWALTELMLGVRGRASVRALTD